jgi:hypothetical protein
MDLDRMSSDQVQQVLAGNVGKAVKVTTHDGEVWILAVLSVDGEGFTYQITGHPEHDPAVWHWMEYQGIIGVEAQVG